MSSAEWRTFRFGRIVLTPNPAGSGFHEIRWYKKYVLHSLVDKITVDEAWPRAQLERLICH